MPPEQSKRSPFCVIFPLNRFSRLLRIALLSVTVAAVQLPETAHSEVTSDIAQRQVSDQKCEQTCRISGSMQKFFVHVTQYFGTRYRSGGQTPAGFDCSGFVRFMFSKVFNMELPRSSREMAAIGNKIGKNELQPGDLVFFQTSGSRINHVGIFIGNDTFVHSSLTKGITEDQLKQNYYEKRFAGAVRLFDAYSGIKQKSANIDSEPS
ncbi:C40 family peptidase [Chlorobium sp. BLA1]|nr:C40 family peptidase [Candidatus Chlorobium masyuteum]